MVFIEKSQPFDVNARYQIVMFVMEGRNRLEGGGQGRHPRQRERWNLIRRELYVAMTRSRDSLWVGIKEHTG